MCFFVCLFVVVVIDIVVKRSQLGTAVGWLGRGNIWRLRYWILHPCFVECWYQKENIYWLSLMLKKCVKADDIRWWKKYLFNVHGQCAERDCDNKWGSFDQLEKQSENAIVMRIIKERKQKLEKEKNNDDTNEYRHKERGGLRAINILADCPLTPTARNITHIYSRQVKCSRNYSSTVQDYCSNVFGIFWEYQRNILDIFSIA